MKVKASVFILVIGALVVGKFLFFPSQSVPIEFSNARAHGAEIARHIVTLSGNLLKGLEEISWHDKRGETAQALILISQKIIESRQNQEEAIRLAGQMEKMARNISKIRPASARNTAAEAVTAEVTLVSRLVAYNDYLKQLFEILRSKFETGGYYSNGHVEELIRKINDEAAAINDLDRRFNEALAKFDELIK